MDENTSPLPFFSAAGYPADFFSVANGISNESALEGASMFLDTAISLASNTEEQDGSVIFAVHHLAEMAKALVDTVVCSLIEARREADREIANTEEQDGIDTARKTAYGVNHG